MKKAAVLLSLIFILCSCGKPSGAAKIQSAAGLAGKKIGTVKNTIGSRMAAQLNPAELVIYNSADLALEALEKGEIYALIYDLDPARRLVAARSSFSIASKYAFEPVDYAAMVKKGNTDLLGLVDTVFAESKSKGTYDDLLTGFIGTPENDRSEYITPSQTGTKGELVLGTTGQAPPLSYKNGNDIVGLDIELAKLIAKKADFTLRIEVLDEADFTDALKTGLVDMIFTVYPGEDANSTVDFSNIYYTAYQAIIYSTK